MKLILSWPGQTTKDEENQNEHNQNNIKDENENNVDSMNFRTNEPVEWIQECGLKECPGEWIGGVNLGMDQGTSERMVE